MVHLVEIVEAVAAEIVSHKLPFGIYCQGFTGTEVLGISCEEYTLELLSVNQAQPA